MSTGQGAVLFEWEGNRRSDVALASDHILDVVLVHNVNHLSFFAMKIRRCFSQDLTVQAAVIFRFFSVPPFVLPTWTDAERNWSKLKKLM